MKLPDKLESAIFGDTSLQATVHAAIEACEPIISTRPEFFPEYTDHGPSHNTEVLETAIGLLTDEALKTISSADYAILALSVLLHDSGMHLTGDTFFELVSPSNKLVSRLDEATWHELWEEFLLEAKRFDGRQLKNLFGSPDPISVPNNSPADLTLKHRLLIGEFLRRNHPRLAHEISIFGFPALNGERVPIVRSQAGDLGEVAGLIARSHGMSLREACDVFRTNFHVREYKGVHPPILMAALRIADYLQIQPERAPKSLLKLHKLKSPFSMGEWRVHQSVRNITPAGDDPEAIFVDANPENVATFLKFKHWAVSFQTELDSTWAALGEIYGRFTDQNFDKFQLRLRRLRTSIDDKASFAAKAPYLPAKVKFDASSPDLLGLLVAPLYGNRPEIGLRELIQNSIDSVLERNHVENLSIEGELNGHDTDVIVYPVFEGDEIRQVVVEDRGIGMDADILQNYFLRAGASFRSSPQWKKAFTTEVGDSEVARTGRFGVGALAGFLLGSLIEVETRRLGKSDGLKFVAELDSDAIEVSKCSRCIGTKITISVDPDKRKAVGALFLGNANQRESWDWYCNLRPNLVRLDKHGKEILPAFSYPDENKWFSSSVTNYTEVVWSRAKVDSTQYRSKVSAVYSNGILICELTNYGDSPRLIKNLSLSTSINAKSPTVLVTDKDGHLPVNLQRDGFSETDQALSDSLRNSLARDLIAQALALAPEGDPFVSRGAATIEKRKLEADFLSKDHRYHADGHSHWCWEDQGWRLADLNLATKKPFLLMLHHYNDLKFLADDPTLLSDVSIIWKRSGASGKNFNDLKEFYRTFHKKNFWNRSTSTYDGFHLPYQTMHSVAVHKKLVAGNLPNYLISGVIKQAKVGSEFATVNNGNIDHPILSKLAANPPNDGASAIVFTFVAGQNNTKPTDDDILLPMWSDMVGEAPIPPRFEARRDAFPKAFKELGEEIEYYRKVLTG